MKYKLEDYIDCGFYSSDEEIENHKEKMVCCKKPHICATCQSTINTGDHALRETGFMDGAPVSCYTCTQCLDNWLDEISEVEK